MKSADLAVYSAIRRLAHTPVREPTFGDEDPRPVEPPSDQIPAGTKWLRRYSRLGEHGAVWLALGVVGCLTHPKQGWGRATTSVAAAHVTSSAIKFAIGRRRPEVEDLPHLIQTPTGLSFPSSHASSSFAAARAYGRLLPAGHLYTAAVSMAFTRVYLGVHYPSDIAAGAALGTVIGSLGRS